MVKPMPEAAPVPSSPRVTARRISNKRSISKGFGKAAQPMARYFQRIEERWKQLKGKAVRMDDATIAQYRALTEGYPPAFRAAHRTRTR